MLRVEIAAAAPADAVHPRTRLGSLRQPWLPRRVTWHGTLLSDGQVAAAVAITADALARNGVDDASGDDVFLPLLPLSSQ